MTAVDTTTGAFVAGLVTSLHCVGMCGPLACAWATGSQPGQASFVRDTSLYHGAKLLSYAAAGALAGTLGIMPLRWFQHGAGLLLPWLLVGLFVVIALGLDGWVPKPRFLSLPLARMKLWALRQTAPRRAAMLGLATPLVPCGPLYLMLGIAMANGSASRGAQFALAFGLGTMPLLWLAQTQLGWINFRLKPGHLRGFQRGMALCAALIMAWRLRGTISGEQVVSCCMP